MNLSRFRPLVWLIVVLFSYSTTPHIELMIPALADLIAPPLVRG